MDGPTASARLAEPGDDAQLVQLREDALRELRPLRGGELYAPADPPGAGDADRPVWAGVLGGAVVGYLAARVEGRVGVVDAVYVDPDCRAVGVGEAMMACALDWFRGRGCVGVDARALPGARATKNFFEETGFTARLLVMHHQL